MKPEVLLWRSWTMQGGGRDAVLDFPAGMEPAPSFQAGVVGNAFDNRASTDMGLEGVGPSVLYSGFPENAFGELSALSVVVWINATSTPGGSAQLFSIAGTVDPLIVGMPDGTKVSLQIGEKAAIFQNAQFGATDQWIFIAMTYDARADSQQIKCYVGIQGSDVLQLVGARDFSQGAWDGEAKSANWLVAIGNTPLSEKNRPFKGLIDQVRFYGSSNDETGALSQDALETLFRADQK